MRLIFETLPAEHANRREQMCLAACVPPPRSQWHVDFRPHCCLFLEDTHLRMHDKIAGLFQGELRRRGFFPRNASVAVTRLTGEVFSIDDVMFIANSKPDLVATIGCCLRQFLRGRGIAPGCAPPERK